MRPCTFTFLSTNIQIALILTIITSRNSIQIQFMMMNSVTRRCAVCLLLCPFFGVRAQHSAKKEVLYLSGTDATHTTTWDFFCTGGQNSNRWTTIQVPSQWE